MVAKIDTKIDNGKEIIRIGFEDVETWPAWCLREEKDCRKCHFEGKIFCQPRWRAGLKHPLRATVESLLKERKRPSEVHRLTGVNLATIYSVGQKLRRKGKLTRLYEPHPEEEKHSIVNYVREHPREQYKDIAKLFKVEPSYISRLCSKAGIHRRLMLEAEKKEKVKEALQILTEHPERSITSVAEGLGFAPTTLGYHLKRAGFLPIHHEARVFLESVRAEVISAVLEAFSILKKERIIIIEKTVEK